MKKRILNLSLTKLEIRSFITEPDAIRGGDFLDSPLCGPSDGDPDNCGDSYTGQCCP